MTINSRLFAAADAKKNPTVPDAHSPSPIPIDSDRGSRYALRALERECQTVAAAGEGQRDHAINTAAYSMGQLIGAGLLDEDQTVAAIWDAARSTGQPDHEIANALRHGHDRNADTGGIATGKANPRTVQLVDLPAATPAVTVLATEAHQNTPDHTSWWYRDLGPVLDGSEPESVPAVLFRADGKALFYPGRVNGLIGESESGKTWVALLAVAQELRGARKVLYLDFEDSATGIVGRLHALGVTDEHLRCFAYIDPDEALGAPQQADLGAVLTEHSPSMIVVDGFNAAMTLLGLNLESNTDATIFAQTLLKPLANTGATVIYVDHVPKNKDNQGKGGIGAQAKRAMTTGCAMRVDVTQEFGKGMTGYLKLTVDKDRPGHVRAVSAGAKVAGTAVLVSDADTGHVDLRIDAPDLRPADERGPFRPTALMQKISLYLVTVQGDGVSGAEIERNVTGNAKALRQALEMLVIEGYVSRKVGARNAVLHKSVQPFLDNRLNFDPTSSARPDLVSTSSETGSVNKSATSSARPTPYRGDEVDEVSARTDDTDDLVPDVRKRLREERP